MADIISNHSILYLQKKKLLVELSYNEYEWGGLIVYVPMMKTRQEEFRVAKELNFCYSEKIIPLFEIVDEIYETKYKTDENGDYLKELKEGNTRKTRVKEERTSDDIITLDKINDIVKKATVFIDYFRFDIKKYGTNLDLNSLQLAYKLNNNNNEYVKKLKEVSKKYKNMIPVFSLKKPFHFSNYDIINIINQLQMLNSSIALRIEDEFFDLHKNVIEEELRESDFLLYDINEQNFNSKIIELEDVKNCTTKAKKVILNSPKVLKRATKEYENKQISALTDNTAAKEYSKYNFDGFGDYGGLKDQLPLRDRKSVV